MKQLLMTVALLAIGAAAYVFSVQDAPQTKRSVQTSTTEIENPPAAIAKPSTEAVAASKSTPRIPLSSIPNEGRRIETVQGIEVLKDRNCEVEVHYVEDNDGTVTEAFSCTPREPQAGPYDHYSSASLEALAYADSNAALELGKRLIAGEPEVATRWLLRSLALDSGDLERPTRLYPLRVIVTQRFRSDATGRGDVRAMANMHLYHSLGALFDTSYDAYVDDSRQMLMEAGMPSADIAAIEENSTRLYRDLEEIRQQVRGETWVQEERI